MFYTRNSLKIGTKYEVDVYRIYASLTITKELKI